MPLLFYGYYPLDSGKRKLYDERLRPIETGVFDKFKRENLAPLHEKRNVANFWWISGKKHTHSCFSWHDEEGREQTVFIPGRLTWREALMLIRDTPMKAVIPSAIVFRINNHDGAYLI